MLAEIVYKGLSHASTTVRRMKRVPIKGFVRATSFSELRQTDSPSSYRYPLVSDTKLLLSRIRIFELECVVDEMSCRAGHEK
jgi:hypothetical protein